MALRYIVFAIMVGQFVHGQKSFYASHQSWYPKVLAKYTTTTTTTATPTSSDQLANRIGDNAIAAEEPETVNAEEEYMKRLAALPLDKQPFWYRNREAYQSLINKKVDGGSVRSQPGPGRSFFAGGRQ